MMHTGVPLAYSPAVKRLPDRRLAAPVFHRYRLSKFPVSITGAESWFS